MPHFFRTEVEGYEKPRKTMKNIYHSPQLSIFFGVDLDPFRPSVSVRREIPPAGIRLQSDARRGRRRTEGRFSHRNTEYWENRPAYVVKYGEFLFHSFFWSNESSTARSRKDQPGA